MFELSELVVGTLSGCLYIYKATSEFNASGHLANRLPPWRACYGLGTITAVVIGDIRNVGRNSIICISAEGGCYMFDYPFILLNDAASLAGPPGLTPATLSPTTAAAIPLASNEGHIATPNPPPPLGVSAPGGVVARANWSTLVPTNTSVALIGDIDGDGLNELVLGRTDRKIHAYQLSTHLALPTSSSRKSQAGRAHAVLDYQKLVWVGTSKWRVGQPIASLSLASCKGLPLLVVGQDDGEYLCITSQGSVHPPSLPGVVSTGLATPAFAIPSESGDRDVVVSVNTGLLLNRILYPTLGREAMARVSVCPPSRVIGFGGVPALETDPASPTGVVGWADGTTLLFNASALACTRFQFPHAPVAAFTSGMFNLGAGDVPCLFYVGFKGAIYGYSDPPALSCQPTSRLVPFVSADLGPYSAVIGRLSQLILASPRAARQRRRKKRKPRPTEPSPSSLSEGERLAHLYRYILYTALPLAARPHAPLHPTAGTPAELSLCELLGRISLGDETDFNPHLVSKPPAPAVPLAGQPSALHTGSKGNTVPPSASASTGPAAPISPPLQPSLPLRLSLKVTRGGLKRRNGYGLGFEVRLKPLGL
ncbi:hypothetical protein L0F63_006838 [Massospora cicadina]|nr:hypothetical protein L0F63_006838 [Massospora cicadina]